MSPTSSSKASGSAILTVFFVTALSLTVTRRAYGGRSLPVNPSVGRLDHLNAGRGVDEVLSWESGKKIFLFVAGSQSEYLPSVVVV